MQMKQVITLVLGVLYASGVLAQDRDRRIPDFEEVRRIILNTPRLMWNGTFYPDGSATLESWFSYGFGMTVAPEGSFSFKDVYARLRPCLEQDGSREKICVFLCVAGDSPSYAWHTWYIERTEENKAIVRALMRELLDKATIPSPGFSKGAFEKLLATQPFIEGDLPPLFEYDKAYRSANREKVEAFMRDNVIMRLIMQGRTLSSPEEKERVIDEEIAKWKAEYGLSEDEDTPPSRRPWLYVSILSALCAGAVLWLIRRKRR